MSEKKETNFVKLKKLLPIMKIRKLFDFYLNGENATQFYKLFGFCKFPEGKTEKEKIEEIENFIKNFWEKEVVPNLDKKYNENTSSNLTEIKHSKRENSSNNNPNPINNQNETNQNSVTINLTQSNQNTSQPIPFAQTFNPTPNNYSMFNPFMNYTPSQFGNIFAQPNNFGSQLPPHLQQQFMDLLNKSKKFMDPTQPNPNPDEFINQAINFYNQLPPYLQQQLPPALRYIANLAQQQQTTQIFSNQQPQPISLDEKIDQLIRIFKNMLRKTNTAFTCEQLINVINFLNYLKSNPNDNEINYFFDIIGELSSNNPEENANNLLTIISNNFPEIMNEQIPQIENFVEKQNSI